MTVFLDTAVLMYAAGAEHPLRDPCRAVLQRISDGDLEAVISAEVVQEILHRFVALKRRDMIQPATDALVGLVDEMFPIEESHALAAKNLVLAYPRLSARDAVHAAIMHAHRITTILTFDRDFRAVPGIRLIVG